jgi:hypothetical protein
MGTTRIATHILSIPWADLTTVMREIPFSAIQFPLYEGLKRKWGEQQGAPVNSLQAGLCGSFAGSIAAAVTTPLGAWHASRLRTYWRALCG